MLVFLWARILALDRSCQVDLVKDNGHIYFLNVLASPSVPTDQRILSLFVLSVICSNCRVGQQVRIACSPFAFFRGGKLVCLMYVTPLT